MDQNVCKPPGLAPGENPALFLQAGGSGRGSIPGTWSPVHGQGRVSGGSSPVTSQSSPATSPLSPATSPLYPVTSPIYPATSPLYPATSPLSPATSPLYTPHSDCNPATSPLSAQLPGPQSNHLSMGSIAETLEHCQGRRPASPPPSGLKSQAKDLLKQFSFSKKTAEMAGPSGGVAEPDRVARRKFQQFMFTQEETEFKPPPKVKAKQGRELTVHITPFRCSTKYF